MSRFKYIYRLAVLLLFTTASCKKTLELSPEDYFADGNFWQNETQVSNFMYGLHNQFRGNYFMFFRLGEMRGGGFSNIDVQNTSLNELQIIEQRIEENSAGVSGWAGLFGPILQLNLFISNVEPAGFLSAEKKSYLLGQAYAMRAYYYFHLLRTYGGVPLWTEPEVLNTTDPVALRKARATEEQILAQVKADVNRSLESFGAMTSTDKKMWNPNAARMLKAEIYLWSAKVYGQTADLTEAKTALNSVTGTALLADFKSIFSYENKSNSEIIFAVHNQVGESEMSGVAAFTYSIFNFDGQHYGDSLASDGAGNFLTDPLLIANSNSQQIIQRYRYKFELFESYDVSDTRRDATFFDYYKVNTSEIPYTPTVKNTALVKFLGAMNANRRYFSADWPVYREADRILMLAEITNAEGGDPSDYIKLIRDRAYADADPTPFVNSSKDENELAIFEERSKEFVYEGKRWYDIRRMKFDNDPLAYISDNHPYGVIDKATQSHMLLWPIEPAIWTNDPLVDQTPGYPTAKPN